MHPNPTFRREATETNISFAMERGFGVLAINATEGPLLAHIPFVLNGDGKSLVFHLVRSNPILKHMAAKAVIAVSGPDSYISPDWYGVPDQVPTWNYVAVHLRGTIRAMAQDRIQELVDHQSSFFEERLVPKPVWQTGKMTPDVLQKMLRMIVPCEMDVAEIDGTWKLGQNKPKEVRCRAAAEVTSGRIGQESNTLAGLMMGAKQD